MIRYFIRSLGAHFRSGKSLYLLTVLGVSLGVASVLSVQIINLNAIAAFEGSVQAVSGDADFSVLGRMPTMPEHLYPDVLAEPGVAAAWPLYTVDVAVRGRHTFFLQVVGIDFFAPTRVPWSGDPMDVTDALSLPGWVAVTPALATEMGWRLGDSIQVTSGTRRAWLTVGALVDFQRASPLASRTLALMDIAQAQSLLGNSGEIHQIDVRAAEGVDLATLMARLSEKLGPTIQAVRPEERIQQAVGLLGAFRLNLTALSLISLFVGLFLVFSSTQAYVVRRRRELGVLRSSGATRGQVFGLIIGEVALLGLLGIIIGLPLGYWIARANVDIVSSTLTNLYLLQRIETLYLPPWLFILAALIGIGGAAIGALIPALDMSRKDTRALLAAFTLHEKVGSLATPLFIAGVGIVTLAAGWYWLLGKGFKWAGFVLGIAVLLALPLLVPLLVQRVARLIRLRGFGLGYSFKSLGARLQTTTFAVAALAIAVSMLIGITLMIDSFRRTLEVWIEAAVRADIYVTTESWSGTGNEAKLDGDLVAAIAAHPGVDAADSLRGFFAQLGDRRVAVFGVDMMLPGGEARFPLVNQEPADAFRRAREEGAVIIGETLARRVGLKVGDSISVPGPLGELRFPIAGVYYDYSTSGGTVAMHIGTMNARYGAAPVNSMALYLESQSDPERVVDELRVRFADAPLLIRSNRTLREEVFHIFDQTFAITRILQGMSLLIAVCGITLALLVLAREQVSELALYRALGARRRQLFRVFVGKGVGMGLGASAMGIAGGLALAVILIFVINRDYFGWTIQPYWQWWPVLQEIGAILAAAALASLYPAFRATQTPATELSRDDV